MVTKDMIEKYLSGDASAAERQIVLAYLSDENTNADLLREVINDFEGDTLPAIGNSQDREQLLFALRQKLYPVAQEETVAATPIVAVSSLRIWLKRSAVAACVLLAFSAGWYFLFPSSSVNTTDPQLLAWNIRTNNTGKVQHIELPDHSAIWLKPHASVEYQQGIAVLPLRSVRLKGEGFFDVVHKTDTPFVVSTGSLKTEVLGTAFNIESYPSENVFHLALVRGKVQVSDTAALHVKPFLITANHQIVYHSKGRALIADSLSISDAELYKSGSLVLSNIPLKDALERIATRFGYNLHVHPSVKLEGKHISGVYKETEAAEVLQLVLFVSQYKFRIRSNTIEIFP